MFAIDRSNFRKSMINPFQKYTYEVRDQYRKSRSHLDMSCLYCCKKGHTISKCRFRRFLVLKGIYQWFPKGKKCFTHTQEPNECWVLISDVWYFRWNVLSLSREDGFSIVVAQDTWRVTFRYSLTLWQRRKDLLLMVITAREKYSLRVM